MPLRPTLRDISRKTGFSTSTVSAALNNDPRVKAETKSKIRAAADELGYTPDPALMALSAYRWSGRRSVVGMTIAFLWDLEKSLTPRNEHRVMLEAMKRRSESLGYTFYEHRLSDLGSASSAQRILESRGTSGLIVGPIFEKESLEGFDWSPFSALAVDLGHYRPPIPLITNNPITCIQIAWRKAIEAGHKRVGVVFPPDSESDFFNEQRSWVYRFQTEGADPTDRIEIFDYTNQQTLKQWVEKNKPDVVIGYHEWLASAINDFGYKIPEDISFISMSKVFQAYPDIFKHPEISGTFGHPDHLGRMAVDQADLLIRRNEKGEAKFNYSIYVDLSWHEGTSVQKPS